MAMNKIVDGVVIEMTPEEEQAHIQSMAAARPIIPQHVTRFQLRVAMQNAGILNGVASAVAAAPAGIRQIWDESPVLHRNGMLVAELANRLNLSSEQVDDLFVEAGKIRP